MKTFTLLLLLLTCASAGAQQKSYTVEIFGSELADRDVFGIDTAGPRIYVAADTAGIYVHDSRLDGPFTWIYLGLRGEQCRAVAVSPANPSTILVALDRRNEPGTTDEIIYRSTDWGMTWTLSQTGIITEGRPVTISRRLEFNPGNHAEVVAVMQGTGTYISRDTGQTWSPVAALDNYTVNDIAWDATRPGTLFAGGESLIMSAILLKSTDGGTTWRNTLSHALGGDNAIDAITINPNDPDMMIAATEGYILRSTDAGENWEIMAHPDRYYLYGAAWSNLEPQTLFITGGNVLPNSGGIFVSNDNGSSWRSIDSNRWRTVQRAIVSPVYPGALFFTAGNFPGVPPDGYPGGVYLVREGTSRVPVPSASAAAWQSDGIVHLRNSDGARALQWELVDIPGNRLESGSVESGASAMISLAALPAGLYLLRYLDDSGVSTLKVVVGE